MNFFLFKIEFDNNSEQLNVYYEGLSDIEKEKISQMDVMSSFDFDSPLKKYTCYLLTTQNEIISYKNILDNNLIPYICEDISISVINGQIDIEEDLLEHIDTFNIINYEIFIEDINNWIFDNLDLDSILDRISQYGIDSLRKIDREYLSKQ